MEEIKNLNLKYIDEIVATGHLAWCDEKYAPGVSPKEVTPNEEVKEESASVEGEAEAKVDDSIETEEVNIDDHLVEVPKEDNDGE